MANTKLHGMLNLSRIPKELITTNTKGEKVIWIDILENYDGQPDQYGNTHSIQVYNKDTREKTYLGNLKQQTFGNSNPAPAPAAPAADEGTDDLPF